ncbi:hypothetical protein ACEUWK_00320 [Staphylococcus pseudintermedius]|uniref:hypothetical protein n=1 Tax=Staphylococcus pseudintermedius TaxID=283734 RepID=UPI00255FEEE9|nr:hypothetical protein [Staphylococcus pseudintermedius]ELI4034032.1 hypothetical protein [Staphylococcus pseudintermedius]MDK3710818.1 hypothetical protein [Staphylococcus pseudintermedius]MDK3979841.1 hypothetical protein [Staphylococcus pseudintermedius]MDK4137406.1 hypothetical protein [Staphylococcus pseudintermedius]
MKRKNRKGRGMKILALLHHQIVVLNDFRFFDIEALKVLKRLRDFLLKWEPSNANYEIQIANQYDSFLNIHAPIPFMKRYLLVIKYSSQTIRTIDSQDRQLVSSSRV